MMSLRWIILVVAVFAGVADICAQTVDNSVDREKRTYMNLGGSGDGFSRWESAEVYIKPCPDRYIAFGESVILRVESNAASFKWYQDDSFLTAGVDKSYTVRPTVTTVYKVLALADGIVDSCYITVHVVDRFGGGRGDGYTNRDDRDWFLLGGGDRYLARGETVELNVESHTGKITWYDETGTELATDVKSIMVNPSQTSVYKAVANDGVLFKDSCYITVHVKDSYAGKEGDGFDWSKPPTYLIGGGDRFIARQESVEIYVDSHTNKIDWYDESGNKISGFQTKSVVVDPIRTSVYKAVANDGTLFKDSCYITVHVKDSYAGKEGDGFDNSEEPAYLTPGPECFIAAHEEVTIKVWSHTQDVMWFDPSGNKMTEVGKNITVKPLVTSTYMAYVKEGDFCDSCYVTVHVNDNYAGGVADGFTYKDDGTLYLKACSDRYIAKEETVSLGVETSSRVIKWYKQPENIEVGQGRMIDVDPDTTTLYKIVADLGEFVDSAFVTVHVLDNYTGLIADGYSKSCGPPRILETIAVKGKPCAGTEGIKMAVLCFERDATYEWQKYDSVARRYAAIPDSIGRDMVGKDSSTLLFTKLRPSFNGVYRCIVNNTCGAGVTYSDSLLLHVNRCLIEVELTPDTLELCKGEQKKVAIDLLAGSAPWQYTYRVPSGEEIIKRVESGLSDTLIVSQIGIYQLIALKDESGDERVGAENLPKVVVKSRKQPSVRISGPTTPLCWGEEVALSLSITDGVGPWKIWIYKDNNELADEILTNPVYMTGRDTVLRFTVLESMTYKVGGIEDYYGGLAICSGESIGFAAITVNDIQPVTFRPLADNHFGQCNNIDLFALLQPQINGVLLASGEGSFYIDSVALSGNIWNAYSLRAGDHSVYYKPVESGCLSSSASLTLSIDSMMVTTELSKHDVCAGLALEYKIKTAGKGYSFTLQNIRVSRDGTQTTSVSTEKLTDTVLLKSVGWTNTDSYQLFSVLSVTDRFNCPFGNLSSLKDTVFNHVRPSLKMLTNVGGGGWKENRYPEITAGETVDVRGVLESGVAPWTLMGRMVNPNGRSFEVKSTTINADTVLKEQGLYSFQAEDKYCANWMDEQYIFVKYVKPAYVRMRLFLEGPYNAQGSLMKSVIQDRIPRYFGDLPVSDVIDWVEVELRKGKTGMTAVQVAGMADSCVVVTRDTCLLRADGTVVDRDGNTRIRFNRGLEATQNCYIVVRHRNHLAVMTAKPYRISVSLDSVVLVDFTDSSTVYHNPAGKLSDHMSVVDTQDGKQVWAMSVGEVNENAIVSLLDPNDVKAYGLIPDVGYHILDINFDGEINWPGKSTNNSKIPDDWIKARMNRDKFTEIKFK